MKAVKVLICSTLLFVTLFTPFKVLAQEENQIATDEASMNYELGYGADYKEEIFQAKILEILEEGVKDLGPLKNPYQKVKLKILNGTEKDKEMILEHGITFKLTPAQMVDKDETVILMKSTVGGYSTYAITDKYRLDKIGWFLAIFLGLILVLSRLKGLGSILGLFVSILIISTFIVPQIIAGRDPVLISIIGSGLIMFSSIFLAHGFSKQTGLAVLSTFLALVVSGVLAYIFVQVSRLTGLGSEEAYGLTLGTTDQINLKGLFLGGIIIGTLGVLDDVTTSQTALVFELKKANPKLKFGELFSSALKVGREHISAVVNTLALAYAGVSLPIFILINLNPTQQPLWFLLNSEGISEEIIRTLAGSIGLVLAVPITTLIAAWYISRKR